MRSKGKERKGKERNRGRAKWTMAGIVSLAATVVLTWGKPLDAIPLEAVWSTVYRSNIQVHLCITRFQEQFPNWDLDLLRANVKSALDTWNTYSGVDFRFSFPIDETCTQLNCRGPGDPEMCQDGDHWPPNGALVIRAQNCHGGNAIASTDTVRSGNAIVKAKIGFYRVNQQACNNTIMWTFDHTTAGTMDFDLVLLHELGHAIGFPPHDPAGGAASVMEPSVYPGMRLLWEEDLLRLRDSQPYHYNLVTNRQILHKVSVDSGLSWSSEGNLGEYSNQKIGVAFDPGRHQYLLAWSDPTDLHRIHTILGDGQQYWSEVTHDGCVSHYGPAAVYGEGLYVIAWTLTNDTRHIAYRVSATGPYWFSVQYLTYNGSADYGSMWEPTLAYNANRGKFLLAWTNWVARTGDNSDDNLGHVRVCVTDDPLYFPFANCTEYYVVSNSPPGLACHPSQNECILAWTNHIGHYDHHISYRKGRINDQGYFELFGTGHYYSSGIVSTRLAPDLTHGAGYWMLSWRWTDSNATGRNARMGDANWPNWSDIRQPDNLLQAAPTVQYGSTWNKYAYYYLRRGQ